MNWKQADILFWTLLIITRCNDLLIRLKLSLRERLLNLVGKKYFKFTKPQRDREQVIFPVDFLFHLCIYRFHQSFVVMYLKIYSVKFHGNIVMDLVSRYYKSNNTKRVSPDCRPECIQLNNSYIQVSYLVKKLLLSFRGLNDLFGKQPLKVKQGYHWFLALRCHARDKSVAIDKQTFWSPWYNPKTLRRDALIYKFFNSLSS